MFGASEGLGTMPHALIGYAKARILARGGDADRARPARLGRRRAGDSGRDRARLVAVGCAVPARGSLATYLRMKM